APSPTGRLHIGNIRTAILNWLLAAKHGGTFILRLDDTDLERSKEEHVEAIRRDLTWLGLTWAREERQSLRSARYAEVAASLKASGHLYPCYEAEDELDRRRKRQMARGLPPTYDRAALRLTDAERAALEAEGRQPHWRFRLNNSEGRDNLTPSPTLVNWVDLVRGDQSVDVGSLSDPVLIRADGTCLYTFTSVVDDWDFGVTHIVRGEDHVTNSGVQIQIFEALGAEVPKFAHHSLLVGRDGQALSKRLGALSIEGLRDDGIEPMAVACHAALVGTSDAIEIYPSLEALSVPFDLSKISRAPGRFDTEDLVALNAKLLHGTAFASVSLRLSALGVDGGEGFWNAVRGNLQRLADARRWWDIVAHPTAPVMENAAFCAEAAQLLPDEPWSPATWDQWIGAVKIATGAKGRGLFHPLRLALTAQDAGPELKHLLPLMGKARVTARLLGQTA
ncbi:MAG: glutamate--tRNA ligase, partial [Hyphomicrobiaceae bacterium]